MSVTVVEERPQVVVQPVEELVQVQFSPIAQVIEVLGLAASTAVFDVQHPRFGGITSDVLHNNAVFQAAADMAELVGGIVYLSPRPGGYPLRPRVTQAVGLGAGVTVFGAGYGGRVTVAEADSPHTITVGAQTLSAVPGVLNVGGLGGFEDSGSFLIRGSTEDAVANAAYTSKVSGQLQGAVLTGATTLVGAHTLPTATVTVRGTSGFGGAGTINVGGQIVTYTGKGNLTMDTATGLTTTTFTGCTGGTGTIADGAPVTADTLALPDGAGIGQATNVFQNKDTTNGKDDIAIVGVHFVGPGRLGSTVLNDLTAKAIRLLGGTNNTSGALGWCRRPRIERCTFRDWAGPQIHAFNVLNFHIDSNTFYNGGRGGIIGGNDSHRGTINGNVFEQNHDDCINWQSRGTAGGIGGGAVYPTRFKISGNVIQEADYATESAQLNNGIVVRGGQRFTIADNTVEGSDDTSSIAAGISLRNFGINDIKHAKVAENQIFNTGAVGILLLSGNALVSGGGLDDVSLSANDVTGTAGQGIQITMQNAGATMSEVNVKGGHLDDCGAASGTSAFRISGTAGCVLSGLRVDTTISDAAGSAFSVDSVTSLKSGSARLEVRNPNRLAAASTDGIRIDCSGAAVITDFVIDPSVVVDNGNSVRFGLSLAAGANATGVTIRRPRIPTLTAAGAAMFASGAMSVTAGGTRVVVEHLNPGAVVALDDTNTNVVVDATLGDYFTLAATKNHTINAPSGMFAGWQFTFDVLRSSVGAITTTWNAAFKLAGAWTDPAVNGKRRTITFRYDGTSWVEVTRSAGDT